MQLSDVLYQKSTHTITFPPDPVDPSYFLDLKEHMDHNSDYRLRRIEWRKSKPASWDMWRIKVEFFQVFCQESLPTFHSDIETFINAHPEGSVEEGAQQFCKKYRGYEKTYGVEFVERAMRRCKQRTKNSEFMSTMSFMES